MEAVTVIPFVFDELAAFQFLPGWGGRSME